VTKPPYRIYLGLGSNVKFRRAYIVQALKKLQSAINFDAVSRPYHSQALLPKNSPKSWDIPYINLCASGTTNWSLIEILTHIQHIELSMGRQRRRPHWSPRVIDIDILIAQPPQCRQLKAITLPHPAMHKRAFVTLPLAEIGRHLPQRQLTRQYATTAPTTDALQTTILPFRCCP
jgi:2-amino-4-hydroxy-6-hydroxymethyldihydropteridine diphosphokinase